MLVNIKHYQKILLEDFKKKYGHDVPMGVRGRNSDNRLFRENINWEPNYPLAEGMKHTYEWIKNQIEKQ